MNHRRFMTPQRKGGVPDPYCHRIATRERFGYDTDGFTRRKTQFEKAGSQRLLLDAIGHSESGHGRAFAFLQQCQMGYFGLHGVVGKSG